MEAWTRLPDAVRSERPWIAAATAHPYKFAETVEPLIARAVDPSPLCAMQDLPSRKISIAACSSALADVLRESVAIATP